MNTVKKISQDDGAACLKERGKLQGQLGNDEKWGGPLRGGDRQKPRELAGHSTMDAEKLTTKSRVSAPQTLAN